MGEGRQCSYCNGREITQDHDQLDGNSASHEFDTIQILGLLSIKP